MSSRTRSGVFLENKIKNIGALIQMMMILRDSWQYTSCIFPPQIKDIALDNAKLLLQIDNTKLANDDFKNK